MQVIPHIVSRVFYRRSGNDLFRKTVLDYVRQRILGADPGSKFERRIRYAKWVPVNPMMSTLLRLRYDGVLFEHDTGIVSSCFFQRHGVALHGFSFFTDPDFRNRGLANQLVDWFIDYGRSRPEIGRVRIGAGGSEILIRAYEKLRAREEEKGIRVKGLGWVELVRV